MRLQPLIFIALFTKGIYAALHAFTPDPNSPPLLFQNYATPILDGLAFYTIVTESGPPLPGLTPLYELENEVSGDYFYTTSYSEFINDVTLGPTWPGYQYGEFLYQYVFGDQEPDTVPLYRFWNGHDHFYTTNYNEGTSNGYGSEGITGYVYLSPENGAVPIYRWHTDNYYYTG